MKGGYESGIGAWFDALPFEEACGTGSYAKNNIEYCNHLVTTLSAINTKSVTDFGCGSLESYKGNIDWSSLVNMKYNFVGYDANIRCIEECKKRYPDLQFGFAKLNEIPPRINGSYENSVIIVKDVFIHWHDADIKLFFKNVFKEYNYVISMHSTLGQGYDDDKDKREAYMIDNPKKRKGYAVVDGKLPKLPEGWKYWGKGECYGYHAVKEKLLPMKKLVTKKNIMGDSMKTFIVFRG